MTNSANPDQLASLEANWSGATLFAKTGYIGGSAGKGLIEKMFHFQERALRQQEEYRKTMREKEERERLRQERERLR